MGEWLPLSVKQQAELRERVGSSEEGKKTRLEERVGVEWRRVGGDRTAREGRECVV